VESSQQHIVAENIRIIAKRKKIALIALADFAGVSRAHLFAFLAGKKDVTVGWLAKVAVALDVLPSELLKEHKE